MISSESGAGSRRASLPFWCRCRCRCRGFSRARRGFYLIRPCSALAAGFNLAAAAASGGGGGGGRWWRRRRAPRGGRSGTRSRCSRPTSSTPTPWRRSARGTTTGRACRCACPTAPPCASSSSSCSGPTPASPARSASSGYSCPFMWTAPPPCPPTKGRPASGNSTVNALYITENNSRCSHYGKRFVHQFVCSYSENTTCHMNSRLLFWRKYQRKTDGTRVWRAELY